VIDDDHCPTLAVDKLLQGVDVPGLALDRTGSQFD
jgi:hypothetical protein